MWHYEDTWDVQLGHADYTRIVVSNEVTMDHIQEMHTLVDSPCIKPNMRFNWRWDGDPTKKWGTYSWIVYSMRADITGLCVRVLAFVDKGYIPPIGTWAMRLLQLIAINSKNRVLKSALRTVARGVEDLKRIRQNSLPHIYSIRVWEAPFVVIQIPFSTWDVWNDGAYVVLQNQYNLASSYKDVWKMKKRQLTKYFRNGLSFPEYREK
jgi:hypothetical protein